jgi:hypothetical protein
MSVDTGAKGRVTMLHLPPGDLAPPTVPFLVWHRGRFDLLAVWEPSRRSTPHPGLGIRAL